MSERELPGVIELPGGIAGVEHKLEQIVADWLFPQMADFEQRKWDARPAIGQFLRPPIGTVRNLRAYHILDALERLLDAKKRDMTFQIATAANIRRPEVHMKVQDASRVIGYLLVGEVVSTGHATASPYMAEVYFRPSPRRTSTTSYTDIQGEYHETVRELDIEGRYDDMPILRHVSNIVVNAAALERVREASIRVSEQVAVFALQYLIFTPMRD